MPRSLDSPNLSLNSEDIAYLDECPRKGTWNHGFNLPRISLLGAMNDSLRTALLSGDPLAAKDKLVTYASTPGIELPAYRLYEVVMHHAAMMELIAAYLLGNDGPWQASGPVDMGTYEFTPQSFTLPDGRLRRVVLCDQWNSLRQLAETHAWRTVADMAATQRPMLINAIVIGQSRVGFRSTPWTQGFIHPENKMMRSKKREGKFNDAWQKVYREQTSKKPLEWLKMMQDDNAFDGLVHHLTVEPGSNIGLDNIVRLLGSEEMRRTNCFRFGQCGFAKLCYSTRKYTPESAGWEPKEQLVVIK